MQHSPDDPAADEERRRNPGMHGLKACGSEDEEDDPVASQAGPLLGEEGYHDHSAVSSSKVSSGSSPVFTSRVERLLRERQLRRGEAEIDGVGGAEGIKDEHRQRLLVVANRLPVSAIRIGDNAWALELSAGGLVSALLGVKQFETKWIGWAGVNVQDAKGKESLSRALGNEGFVPVFLDEQTVSLYYNGYCNNVLWPLFHYIGLTQDDRMGGTHGLEAQFNAYKRANKIFAEVVLSHYQKGDVVWCHDYHLMFLPKFLKEANSGMKVGWFLHTPFPSSEIYRTLPQRSELLQAVLTADLIGFHTYDYARHFVSGCTRILGLEGTPDGVENQGKLTRIAAFPIGIDADRFVRALQTPTVNSHIQELSKRFLGRKVMLGVDRLDMIKGIPQKLLAFEKFLEDNPEWHDKVIMVQIAVPTRTDVHEYQKLSSQVHEIVGRINGRFGTLTTVPIHHLDRSLEFYELCALYAITDVLLVTSLRDGMNLVSYEYVACQDRKKGVLVLSEFAGAAQSLGAGAILINPWNIVEAASGIADALNMTEMEREERHRHNFSHVTSHTAQLWADTFVSELNDTVVEAELRISRVPPQLPVEKAISNYMTSKNCLLILGFNAALTAQTDTPRFDRVKEILQPSLHETLGRLCADSKVTILILSGSERSVLDEAFGDFNLWLAAENGMFLRHTSGDWMTTMPEHLNLDWVESVQQVFDYFSERTPRSFVESRETSLVWNFKYADPEFGRVQAWDMLQHLSTGPISNAAVDVVQGSKSVEVRPVGVSKGAAIDRILGEVVHSKHIGEPIDIVMCIGHFLSKDEDIYTFFEPDLPYERDMETKTAALPGSRPAPISSARSPDRDANFASGVVQAASVLDLKGENYFSCTVGRQHSLARYSLASSEDVGTFLSSLAKSSTNNKI